MVAVISLPILQTCACKKESGIGTAGAANGLANAAIYRACAAWPWLMKSTLVGEDKTAPPVLALFLFLLLIILTQERQPTNST